MAYDADYQREYRARKRAKHNAYMKAWRAKRKATMTDEERERKNEYQREWTRKNPEKARAAKARWKAKNRERCNELSAAWYKRKRQDPKFREQCAAYKRAWRARQSGRVVRNFGPTLFEQLHLEPLYAAASAAVPGHLSQDIRDDVISNLCIAHLEGEIDLDSLPQHAREFINKHYREREWSKVISFDQQIGKRTIGEIVGAY